MPPIVCPRCFTELEDKGEWWGGGACECEKCKGILTDKNWLESNMHQGDYLRLTKRVFTGSPAGILCPHCLSVHPRSPIEMTKFTVSPDGKSYEVDGCQKCGSMWFDQGELEAYEEGEVGDSPLEKTSEKKSSNLAHLAVDGATSAPELAVGAAEASFGILDVLAAIISGL